MPLVETVSAAFGALAAGIELKDSLSEGKVGISLRVKQFAIGDTDLGGGAALVFLVVTNQSDSPRSVTDIVLDFGTSRATRMPLLELESPATGHGMLDARSYNQCAFFEVTPPFMDLRMLALDLYLRPNESQSGCALFVFERTGELSPPLVIVEVGGLNRLSKQLAAMP